MPIQDRKSDRAGALPDTFRVAPANTTPVRCFDSQLGVCREVKFQALDDNSQTNVIAIGDSDAVATSGAARGQTLKPGATMVENWIDPRDWYVATEGDSKHGVSVTATK